MAQAWKVGDRVRVDRGHAYGATGTIVARRGNAWLVKLDGGWGYVEQFGRYLLDVLANNGD